VIDFFKPLNNCFLVVREFKITGLRAPSYNRRADLVCFVNGLPLVFFELKAVYKNIRAGFDDNLRVYLDENVIGHAFYHNAFLVVSNGDSARYGSITSAWEHFGEWKRLNEKDKGSVDAEVLLNGMLAKDRLLDLVENFILFDASKPGTVRKVVARNHQVLGVNLAVAAAAWQEQLKLQFPPEERLKHRLVEMPIPDKAYAQQQQPYLKAAEVSVLPYLKPQSQTLQIIERAHPDLGRLGVVWHTQGSGKSYSMAFFAEKVRRTVSGNFTFVLMTDRNDLDSQIYKNFVGCGIADDNTPRADSGKDLEVLLKQNHRYVFSLIHKFNQDVNPVQPYSERDDIIVISDEAHRTQSGKLARNMRLALPNAAFIGFTGTPLFKYDELTKRIFGSYVSRYDFKRSEEDGATVKLVYENRGEKLKLARLDLNDKIAEAIVKAELNPDQEVLLEKLLGKDYEVIAADDRLMKVAADFVEHCTTRWESGKVMLVCIDKVTCARMLKLIQPLWKAKALVVRAEADAKLAQANATPDEESRQQLYAQRDRLLAKAAWIEQTLIEIIISEAQNEVADFKKWDFTLSHIVVAMLKSLRDAVEAIYGGVKTNKAKPQEGDEPSLGSSESKRRFEILSRVVFTRFKSLLMEPSVFVYAERHDNIEAIYKKLSERRDTAEETFAKVMDLISSLDEEQRRTVKEGLSEEQLALFDLIQRGDLSKTARDKVKEASRELLAEILTLIAPLDQWAEKEQTQAEVKTFILDQLYQTLPEPPYTSDNKQHVAGLVYQQVWRQSVSGRFSGAI